MSTSLCRIALVSTDWSEMLRNSRKDSLRPAGPPVLIRTEEAANLAKDLSASFNDSAVFTSRPFDPLACTRLQ